MSEYAAIVAGAIAALYFAWSVCRWLWSTYRADEIDHGLHVSNFAVRVFDGGAPTQSLRFEFKLKNGLGRAPSFRPQVFTVYAADRSQALGGEEPRCDVAPGQVADWFREVP